MLRLLPPEPSCTTSKETRDAVHRRDGINAPKVFERSVDNIEDSGSVRSVQDLFLKCELPRLITASGATDLKLQSGENMSAK